MGSYIKGLVTTAIVVLIVSFVMSMKFFGNPIDSPVDFGKGVMALAFGPLTGWVFSAVGGSINSALWSLIPLTAISIGLLVSAQHWPTKRRLFFAAAGIFWVFSGYFYSVAVWI